MSYMHLPRSFAGRTLMASWSLMTIITVAAYCGNLIAFLTVTKVEKPFESLKGLVQNGQFKWGTIGGTLWEQNFLVSNIFLYV